MSDRIEAAKAIREWHKAQDDGSTTGSVLLCDYADIILAALEQPQPPTVTLPNINDAMVESFGGQINLIENSIRSGLQWTQEAVDFACALQGGYSIQGQKQPVEPRESRTDKDYAIEHAEYLATAASNYLQVCQSLPAGDSSLDMIDQHSHAALALESRIYEFRKRAERAKRAPETDTSIEVGRCKTCGRWLEVRCAVCGPVPETPKSRAREIMECNDPLNARDIYGTPTVHGAQPQSETETSHEPPCDCTQYNGRECSNCLNGAHSICKQRPKCQRGQSLETGEHK